MEQPRRSRRTEIAGLRAELAAKDVPLRQIARAIAARYNVSSRVAYRLAHGLTQQQVTDRWNELWPAMDGESIITYKHISYWESWPAPTGRAPSPDTLNRLARIYRCSAAELLDGEDHTKPGTTPMPGPSPATPSPADATVVAEPSDVLTRIDQFIAMSDTLVTRESEYHQPQGPTALPLCRHVRAYGVVVL